jgi:lipooligosaccharide transport system permease protein
VQLSPLYHGVALVRAANSGAWSIAVLGHIAVLLALSAVALLVASRRIDQLLRK